MDNIETYRCKKEVIQSILHQGITHKKFTPLIKIYLGMIDQMIDIETRLQDATISEDSRKILEGIHRNLITDIEEYKNKLVI